MDTARRSSRAARGSQPLQSNSHHSSVSSTSSGRGERATRSHNKAESPRKSTPSASLSSEPPDESIAIAADDTIQTRRKRGRTEEQPKSSKAQAAQVEMANGAAEAGDEDEAVRCICGLDEYPGPPQLDDEDSKHGIKEGIEEPLITPADFTEDLAGFFLQCDTCKVWQHGGCVGIMNEDTSPEEYFCETCRSDLHRIFTAPNGQRYSHYLPLYQSLSRTTSRAASFSKDGGSKSPRGSKSGRPSSSLQSAKRRSTMNSRDAAYDEEEQLRRAIEASKGEKSGESTDGGGTRRGKRGRSDSEEKPEGLKRQRTASASPSPPQEAHQPESQADSDDGTNGRVPTAKKIRGAAARNHKEKEAREEREKSRKEAAQKRMGRAERRRIEESDPAEDGPVPTKAPEVKTIEVPAPAVDPPISSQIATPDTPPPSVIAPTHRKGGRPPNNRKGKLGKNQYTKDRDQDHDDQSPQRSQSRDVTKNDDSHGGSKSGNHEGKPSKSKSSHSKITMADMKRRVAGILDFISRTQLELASESMSPATAEHTEKFIRGIADGLPMIKVNGENGNEPKAVEGDEASQSKDFKDLSCVEMMDVLTRQLVKWQKEFA